MFTSHNKCDLYIIYSGLNNGIIVRIRLSIYISKILLNTVCIRKVGSIYYKYNNLDAV